MTQQPQYPAPPQQQPQDQYPPNYPPSAGPYAGYAGYPSPPFTPPPAPQAPTPAQYPQAPANPYAHPQTAQHYPGPPGYPYGPPYPAAPPQQPPAPQVPAGPPPSLGDFYSQPSTGWGPSVTPNNATPDGTQILMVVAQRITEAHVEQATQYQSTEPAYYRNGKPKLVMKIPAYVAPGTQYWTGQGVVQQIADGRAQYFVQGPDKDALAAAIAAAGGNAAEPPELGAVILVAKTGSRRNPSGTQSAVKTFRYWRPGPEAAGMAQQFGITYPDLSTPKPADASPVAAAVSTAAPAGRHPLRPARRLRRCPRRLLRPCSSTHLRLPTLRPRPRLLSRGSTPSGRPSWRS